MKKGILYGIVAGFLVASAPGLRAQYCNAGGGGFSGPNFVSNVSLGSINNSSGIAPIGGYQDWTAFFTDVTPGVTYTMNVTVTNGGTGSYLGVWVDWNKNFDFTDDAPISVAGLPGPGPYTVTITVPSLASAGMTRMRIRTINQTPLSPCGTIGGGEVEDYSLNVVSGAANDAGIEGFNSPVLPLAPGTHPVKVNLKNYGSSVLASASLGWSLNGTAQPSYTWTGSLGQASLDTGILLGNVTFSTGQYMLKAWSSLPNGQPDGLAANDSAELSFFVCNPLSGTYSIGGMSANYPTLNAAVNALMQCGVSGPVTFNVNPGTYNERMVLQEVPGASATNKITFQSATGNPGDAVIVSNASGTANNYTVMFDGGDYFRLKNLTLQADDSTYAFVVVFSNMASSNVLEGNVIISQPFARNSSSSAGVYSSSSNDSLNIFTNNIFHNGYYGIYLRGVSATELSRGNEVNDNTFTDCYYYGIYLFYQDSAIANNNRISFHQASFQNYGVFFSYCDNAIEVQGNRVHAPGSGNQYGVYINSCDATDTTRGIIANNIVSQTSTAPGIGFGLYLYASKYQDVYHNSVNVKSGGSNSRAFYASGSNAYCNVRNNIFANAGGMYAVYVASGAAGFDGFDHNNLYSSNPVNLAYWSTGNFSSIAALQLASGFNGNTVSLEPKFIDQASLYPGNIMLDNLGIPISKVPVDIDSNIRSLVTPDLGALEFSVPANNAGVVALHSPISPIQAGPASIQVSLKNFGTATLASAMVWYSVNGSLPVSTPWSGSLAPDSTSSPVSLGAYSFNVGINTLKVWTSLPNGVVDSVPMNDTLTVLLNVCNMMSGIYTIGDTSLGADYAGFNEALNAMLGCGINGSVTFNVQPGVYNEQISIPPIYGASSVNRVTFQSATGVNTDVILHYQPVLSSYNYVLKLDGADHIDILNFTIRADSATYGRVLVITNGADDNLISGNNLKAFQSVSSDVVPLYASGSYCNYNVVSGNRMEGGYYGIYWYGTNTTSLWSGNAIVDNTVLNWSSNGIRCYYQDNLTVSRNTVKTSLSSGSIYGMYFGYCDNATTVTANRVELGASASCYLVYITSCDGLVGTEGLFANNHLVRTGSGTSAHYGLYISSSTHQKFYHNSINISGGSTSSRGIFQNSSTNAYLQVVNNIVSMANGGVTVYTTPAYLAAFAAMDHNVLYTTGINLAYMGFNQANLAAWQAITGLDSNSVSVDPAFVSPLSLYPSNMAVNNVGTPLAEVPDDIDGNIRNVLSPDPGAVEFDPVTIDMGVLGVEAPSAWNCGMGSTEQLSVKIFNNGYVSVSSLSMKYSIDGGLSWIAPEFLFNTIMAGDTLLYTFSTYANFSATGVYFCKVVVTATGDANSLNDTLSFTVHHIDEITTFPFIEDFESGVSEFFYLDNAFDAGISIAPAGGNPGKVLLANGGSGLGWSGSGSGTTPIQAWEYNTSAQSRATSCAVDAQGVSGLILELDLRQELYLSPSPTFSYFRVLVDDSIQVADVNGLTDFNPITSTADPFVRRRFDLSSFAGTAFRLSLQFANRYTADKGMVDNIALYEVFTNDVGVMTVVAPSGSACAGSSSQVVAEIHNFGLNPQVNIPVTAILDQPGGGSDTINGILTDTLHPGMSLVLNLGQANISTIGQYAIRVFTRLATDLSNINDTAFAVFATQTPVVIFPYAENFETFTPGNPGVFMNGWTASSTSGYRFQVNTGATPTNTTGPLGDHTTGSGKFVYTEASNGQSGDLAILTSPCMDLSQLSAPELSFWYHMFGADVAALSVDVLDAGQWVEDVFSLSGQQQGFSGAAWRKAEVDLTGYFGAERVRFRVIRGNGPYGDVAIDDIQIRQVPAQEVALLGITSPISGCDLGNESVSINLVNTGSAAISGNLSASYRVNGGLPVTELIASAVPVNDTFSYVFTTPLSMAVSGDSTFSITAWVSLSGDPEPLNDTARTEVLSAITPSTPAANSVTVAPLSIASLSVINPLPGQGYFWYTDSTTFIPLASGNTAQFGPMATTNTYWLEARKGQLFSNVVTGNGSQSTPYMPLYGFYDNSWSVALYREDELGLTGTIDSISFYVNNALSGYTLANQIIRFAVVAEPELTSLFKPSSATMTTVFNGNVTFSGPGWVTLPLSSPFHYDGQGNLLIVYENGDGSGSSTYPQFRGSAVSGVMAAYDYANGSMPTAMGILSNIRPDLRFTGDLLTGFNGCPSPRSPVTVTVSTSALSVNAGPDLTICQGTTANLNVSVSGGVPPYTYSWNPSASLSNPAIANPVASPPTNTTYSVTVTASNGLQNTDAVIVIVTPGPTVSLSLPADSVCINGSTFQLTGGLPAGGSYAGSGVSGGMFNPALAGLGWHTVSYTYTDPATNCSSTATQMVWVDQCIGMFGPENFGIMVYPIPADDKVLVRSTGQIIVRDIVLLDLSGRIVYTARILPGMTESVHTIEVQHFLPGSYILQISGEQGVIRKKLVVR
jgi:parallel beta-helix repeat protein